MKILLLLLAFITLKNNLFAQSYGRELVNLRSGLQDSLRMTDEAYGKFMGHLKLYNDSINLLLRKPGVSKEFVQNDIAGIMSGRRQYLKSVLTPYQQAVFKRFENSINQVSKKYRAQVKQGKRL